MYNPEAVKLYEQEHEKLLPHIDQILGQLQNKMTKKDISFQEAFYILSKTMIVMAENFYETREAYIKDIEHTMRLITGNVLPSLPNEEENFMIPRLILTSGNMVEYIAYNLKLQSTTQPTE